MRAADADKMAVLCASANDSLLRLLGDDPFRLLVEAVSDDAVFLLTPEGVVASWNPGSARIMGYQSEEMIGASFAVLYGKEAVESNAPQQELALAAEAGSYEGEGWRIRKDGSRLWARVTVTALRRPDGKLVGFGAVTRDLEQRARQGTGMVEAVVGYAIFRLDPQGRVMIWNRGAQRIFGYSTDEIMGCHCSAFYPPESIQREVPTREMAAAEQEGSHEHEDWCVCKDGATIWASITTTALRGSNGLLLGFSKVVRDLTAKRAVEEDLLKGKLALTSQLASAYSQVRSITDSMTDGIIEVDPHWKILFGNIAAGQLPDFKIGKDLWECFPGLVGTDVQRHFNEAMVERTHISYENYYEPYNMWFRARLSPTDNGLVVIFTDVTRERKLQEQLELEQVLREKRVEALSHMAGGLAHEINNPLAIIRAMAGDLQDALATHQGKPTFDMQESCESILHMADRATRILKGLRGFAREAGHDPKEWASLYDIVSECVDMQRSRFDRQEVTLGIALDDDLPPFLCRATQIAQILTNLLNNALDAIVQSDAIARNVLVTAHRHEGFLAVRVTDSGPGVEEQFRAHLMEPFFTTKVGDLGMGIGLSLSRAIAEDHGGSLQLLDGETQTCFQLTVPIDAETIQ